MPHFVSAVRDLVSVGLSHVGQPRRFGWIYAVFIGIALFLRLVDSGFAMLFAAAVVYGLTMLVASRQMLTGEVTASLRDLWALGHLIWLLFLLALLTALVLGIPIVLLSRAPIDYPPGLTTALSTLATSYVATRIAFIIPALAVGDPTGLQKAFDQTRPIWPPLFVYNLLLAAVFGLVAFATAASVQPPAAIAAVAFGAYDAASILLVQAPICWLYARTVRREATDAPP